MNIAILTSNNQWFVPFAQALKDKIKNSQLFYEHQKIDNNYDIVFILSYHKIIAQEFLNRHKHNIVIHGSKLPSGKGWSPLFWQVLEGENNIPFTMFEASDGVDNGDIYVQKILNLTGYELNKELREKQAELTIDMCIEFLTHYQTYKAPEKQIGQENFYPKRTKKDSELDVNKNIKEQFNLLRIVDNNEYPAYFEIDGNKYQLQIERIK